MLLCSSAPQGLDAQPASPKTPEISKVLVHKNFKSSSKKRKQKAGRSGKKNAKEQQKCDEGKEDAGNEKSGAKQGKGRAKSGTKIKAEEENHVTTEQMQPDAPLIQSTQAECEYCFFSQFYVFTSPSASFWAVF